MLTLRSAGQLLAAASDLDALVALAAAIGCSGAPARLDAPTRSALGIPDDFGDVRICPGDGTLRALVLEVHPDRELRACIARLAARLAARAPHLLWIAVAGVRQRSDIAIAAWHPVRSAPRVAALVADRRRIVDSDAETVCALAAAASAVDVLTHARWLEVLGREALTRRFYRTLEQLVSHLAESAEGARASRDERGEFALLVVSRLLFLCFLEAKGWLDRDRDFLSRTYATCLGGAGGYHHRVLLPLFFGTLNTPPARRAPAAAALGRIPFLNGGLFAPSAVERRHRALRFGDEALGRLFGELLDRYRFTAREDGNGWSEAAVDPEMLGKAFESLMASRERRASGAYYTPQALVDRVTAAALRDVFAPDVPEAQLDAILRGEPAEPELRPLLRRRVSDLRVLDPACGSGAFLVHTLERLAAIAIAAGDPLPVAEVRRTILVRSIFGVDVNPTAVWLCEMRLWLSTIIESEESDPLRVRPLPNLDRHVRVGDSLGGGAFGDESSYQRGLRVARHVSLLRMRYVRAVGQRKRTLHRELERSERSAVLAALEHVLSRIAVERRELLAAARARDLFGERHPPAAAQRAALESLRTRARDCRARRRAVIDGGALPFFFATHFPDVAARGGFDVIVGNPPWVRLHRIPPSSRAALRREFIVFREAAWDNGAAAAQAARGFGAQVDLAALFVERSLGLLRERGTLALLLPTKLWRSLAGGGVRRLLLGEHRVRAIEDWPETAAAFDAAVYPSLLVAERRTADAGAPPCAAPVRVAVHRRDRAMAWQCETSRLALDATPGSPWLIAPPDVRSAFDRLARAGTPLAESTLGRPLLGVKCGCNEAFSVTVDQSSGSMSHVQAGSRSGHVESAMLRPLLRGEGVRRWLAPASAEHLLWTHGDDGAVLERLPAHAERWLRHWRRRLVARTDAQSRRPWWSLYRVEAAQRDRPRVVWSDVARAPRAAVLAGGDRTVPLNSCYVVRCPDLLDAYALAALLNSPVAAAWLDVVAEPARGGYHRYLAWTVALLPIPADWPRARAILAPLAERALRGDPPSSAELCAAALGAYRVRASTMAPLLTWASR